MRIDLFLWYSRIYKSRTIASNSCKKGHVKVNNKSIKECGDIGSKAAAEIITHYGARPKTSLEKILK